MKHIIILLLIGQSMILCAQDRIHFNYDNSGNRTERIFQSSSNKARSAGAIDAGTATPINGILTDIEVVLYPNPTKGITNIEIVGETLELQFKLYSNGGQLLHSWVSGSVKSVIDLSIYPTGIYILRVQSNDIQQEFKIIKE